MPNRENQTILAIFNIIKPYPPKFAEAILSLSQLKQQCLIIKTQTQNIFAIMLIQKDKLLTFTPNSTDDKFTFPLLNLNTIKKNTVILIL